MNSAGTAYISVHPDLKGFGRELATGVDPHVDKSSSHVQSKFGGAFKSVAGIAAGAFAGAKLMEFGGDMLQLGTQVDTFGKKAKTVFEGNVGDVKNWAKSSASAFGITDDTLLGLAGSFGDLLKPMGFTSAEAAKMSTDVVGLSGSLSAWSGGTKSAAEVSEILAKAMLGERDALKGLGISITETDVSQRLLEKGQQGLTGAALEQAKAVATQELIFEKSKDAQAAWADGSMDSVKKQNALKEKLAELKEDLAAKLLPAFAAVTAWVVDKFIPAFEKVVAWVQENWPEIKRVIIQTWDAIKSEVQGAFDVMLGIFKFMTGVITGDWSRAWDGVKDIAAGAWRAIKDTVMTGVRFVVDTFLGLVETVLDGGARMFGWVPGIGDKLRSARDAFGEFRDDVNVRLGGIQDKTVQLRLISRDELTGREAGQDFVRYAKGGQVPGHGNGDTVPAWLTPGEFVLRKQAVQALGVPYLEQLNAKGYHSGGLVDFAWSLPSASGIGDAAQSMFDEMAATAAAAAQEKFQAEADAAAAKRAASGGLGGGGSVGSTWQSITNALDARGKSYEVTSAYRPGDPGFHGRGKAVDLVGNMADLFHTIASFDGINELFYDPIGWYLDEGNRHSGAIGGHDDHVHAATFHAGGIVPGQLGQDRLAVVEAGERISPVGDAIDYDKLAAAIMRAQSTLPQPVIQVNGRVLGEVVSKEQYHARRR